MTSGDIADAAEVATRRIHPEFGESRNGARHQALAAGLVDRLRGTGKARVDDRHVQSGPRRVERGGQPGGAGPGDQQVDHAPDEVDAFADWEIGAEAEASASSSARIRTRSKIAFSTVNVTAVSHAVCTIGNATPSTTTAT